MSCKERKMNKIDWLIIPAVLVLILLVSVSAACSQNNHPAAPDFTLKDLNGNEISLSDYEGKVLFINFWATWCPPCRAEIPDFIEVYDEYKDQGLEILGVSVDDISPDKVLRFVKANEINYPIVMYTMNLINDYKPGRGIPATIIIDKMGRLRHRQIGMMSKEMVLHFFKELSKDS
jgi:peroxiredoxin